MLKTAKLTDKRYVVPFVLITTLFFLWGFARAILDVLNKHFQDELHISITQSSLIQVTTYLGYFLMAIPAGIFINRYGYRRGVVFGLTLFGLGALAFIPGNTFAAFLGALFVIGCGLTFLETAANPYVTELGPTETASSRLNLSQTFNGMGCFMATLLVGQFLFSKEDGKADVSVPYAIMGVLVLLIALVFTRVKLPEIAHSSPPQGRDVESPEALCNQTSLPWGGFGWAFWYGLLALLSYEVAEISINSYFVNFVTGTGWMSKLDASRVVSLALVIFMVGRFVGSWIMRSVKAESMLMWCAVGTVACMVLTMFDLGMLSLVALIANYLFEAIMFPTIFSLAVQGLGSSQKKSASSLLMMTPIGGCGFLLMGWLADNTNLFVPFVIPFVGFIIVLVYAVNLRARANAKSM